MWSCVLSVAQEFRTICEEMNTGAPLTSVEHAVLGFGTTSESSVNFIQHKLRTLISMSDTPGTLRVVDMQAFKKEVDKLKHENNQLKNEVAALKDSIALRDQELTRLQHTSSVTASAIVPCVAQSEGETQTDDTGDLFGAATTAAANGAEGTDGAEGADGAEEAEVTTPEGGTKRKIEESSPSYRRPRGRAPQDAKGRAKQWDSTEGVWV